jgi:hypothetical protein
VRQEERRTAAFIWWQVELQLLVRGVIDATLVIIQFAIQLTSIMSGQFAVMFGAHFEILTSHAVGCIVGTGLSGGRHFFLPMSFACFAFLTCHSVFEVISENRLRGSGRHQNKKPGNRWKQFCVSHQRTPLYYYHDIHLPVFQDLSQLLSSCPVVSMSTELVFSDLNRLKKSWRHAFPELGSRS